MKNKLEKSCLVKRFEWKFVNLPINDIISIQRNMLKLIKLNKEMTPCVSSFLCVICFFIFLRGIITNIRELNQERLIKISREKQSRKKN